MTVTLAAPTPAVSQIRGGNFQVISSASFTPAANSIIVVACQSFRNEHSTEHNFGISSTGTSDQGSGQVAHTWNLIDETPDLVMSPGPDFTQRTIAWWARIGADPTAMTVTVDPDVGGTDTWGSGLNLLQATGDVDLDEPIGQFILDQLATTTGPLTLTFPAAPSFTQSATIFATTGSTATGNTWPAAPTDWAELAGSTATAVQCPSRAITSTDNTDTDVSDDFTTTGLLGMSGLGIEWNEPAEGTAAFALEAALAASGQRASEGSAAFNLAAAVAASGARESLGTTTFDLEATLAASGPTSGAIVFASRGKAVDFAGQTAPTAGITSSSEEVGFG